MRFEDVKRFEDAEPTVLEGAWLPGDFVSIHMRNGDLEVVAGSGSSARVTVRRFAYLPVSASPDEIALALGDVDPRVIDGNGVLVLAQGYGERRGADVRVELPAVFDSYLAIEKDDGELKLHDPASAYQVNVRSRGGSCQVTTSRVAMATFVSCRAGILSVTVPEVAPPGSYSSLMADLGVELAFGSGTRGQPFRLGLSPRPQYDVVDAEAARCREDLDPPGFSCNGAGVDDALYTATVWQSGSARSSVRF